MTPRQEAMVAFIREHITERGYSPEWRDFVRAGICASTSSVSYNLTQLRDAGIVAFEDGKARTIRVLGEA